MQHALQPFGPEILAAIGSEANAICLVHPRRAVAENYDMDGGLIDSLECIVPALSAKNLAVGRKLRTTLRLAKALAAINLLRERIG